MNHTADVLIYLILFLGGCLAGTINVVAAGGSFLTIPLLKFCGLPLTAANGTNRVGLLMQNVSAVRSFHKKKMLDSSYFFYAALPATLGAVFGATAATALSDDAFGAVLGVIMIGVTLWTLWNSKKSPINASTSEDGKLRPGFLSVLAYFGAGIYGGFVQAGVGFLLIAIASIAGLDLVRGNVVKVFVILIYTVPSLAIFAYEGKVNWAYGLALAAGTFLGARLGVRLTITKGQKWIRAAVTVMVIAFGIKILLDSLI